MRKNVCGNFSLRIAEKIVKIRTRENFVPHGRLSDRRYSSSKSRNFTDFCMQEMNLLSKLETYLNAKRKKRKNEAVCNLCTDVPPPSQKNREINLSCLVSIVSLRLICEKGASSRFLNFADLTILEPGTV